MSTWCDDARSLRLAVSSAVRTNLHDACDGEGCDCPCHQGVSVSEISLRPPDLPEVDKTRVLGARAGRADLKGRCEHCGEPTGGRFAPGHDAKLKAGLTEQAMNAPRAKAAEAWAEMILRDWDCLVAPSKRDRIRTEVLQDADYLISQEAEGREYEFVQRRNQVRISNRDPHVV